LEERREVKAEYFAAIPNPRCPLTGEPLTHENVDIHHEGRTFDELLEGFMQEVIPEVALKTLLDDHETLIDKEVDRQWQEYHRNHAILEVLSKVEHSRRHGNREASVTTGA
jgi:hypothetical protein